jgi:hypothetical protein
MTSMPMPSPGSKTILKEFFKVFIPDLRLIYFDENLHAFKFGVDWFSCSSSLHKL